jgi:ribonuclease P protein component
MLKDPHSPRFGVSVSAKVGNAVVRNRIRRQVKEFFRINPPLLKPDCDYVVVARAEAAGATFALLSRELRFMLSRLDKRTAPAQPRAAAPRATAPHGYATQPHAEGKT